MKIQLDRINSPFHFSVKNESNNELFIDASPEIGGENQGFRPMELLISGLAGCASIDVSLILQKQKQTISDIKVVVHAEREKEVPALFKNIHVHFSLCGEVSKNKIEKAIDLAMDKYCTVAKILERSCEIKTSFDICGK